MAIERIKMLRDRHPYIAGDILMATNVRIKEYLYYGLAEEYIEPSAGDAFEGYTPREKKRSPRP